jgi:hypothetical protein
MNKPISPIHIRATIDLLVFLSRIGIRHDIVHDHNLVRYSQRHS